MGVLMSKKQTVEQVQKASVVVSAFKDGLRDKRVSRTRAEPPPGKVLVVEETGQGQDKEAAGASPSQPSSEEAKRNQEAWERLRDGKGIEPEELEWSNLGTPPSYIRPKRQLGDDQSLDIKLQEREEVTSDEMCEICEVWTADELYPCRTCTRVFHDGCLQRVAQLGPGGIEELKETAHTAVGWSCQYCDNVNLLLTEEEMFSLKEVFRQCRVIPESCLTSDDFLHFKHFVHKQLFDEQMNEEMEELAVAQFTALDGDKKGQMEWTDFLYHETLLLLQRTRSQNSLLRLLTAKERERARSIFRSLDQNQDGLITAAECKRAQQSWFRKNTKASQSCSVSISHVEPMSEGSPANKGRGRVQDKSLLCKGPEESRPVNWKSFLKESAIYVLAARPNSAAIHLQPPA
ncbi:PHD finger protein 24 [Hypanus sabinus]|uniref:PHD finger protein 24 n=1 Tax=Hypanus sabinus TaxID=79690 RepID=UPI0028C44FD4|nr:PHD finger protein 24 [Hypanus sabinus]XP_059829799.1 PHD finger protein 24 [Hypanus sabinus]